MDQPVKKELDENELLAQKMVDRLRKSKKVFDFFTDKIREQYCITGKSIEEWRVHFKVPVPPDLSPATARQLDIKIMDLYQEASFYKAVADIKMAAATGTTNTAYRERFNTLVQQYKIDNLKLPAQATLQTLTEGQIAEEKDSLIHIDAEVSFWKNILQSLQESRKLIENATLNMSVEAKALHSERYLDAMQKNGGNNA
jgi:hypothetical protein